MLLIFYHKPSTFGGSYIILRTPPIWSLSYGDVFTHFCRCTPGCSRPFVGVWTSTDLLLGSHWPISISLGHCGTWIYDHMLGSHHTLGLLGKHQQVNGYFRFWKLFNMTKHNLHNHCTTHHSLSLRNHCTHNLSQIAVDHCWLRTKYSW